MDEYLLFIAYVHLISSPFTDVFSIAFLIYDFKFNI